MANALNLVITPPAVARTAASSADQAIVDTMSAQIADGTWVNDGKTYENDTEAGNASQVYRRALASKLDIGIHTVKSRKWGDNKGVIVTKKGEAGVWRFALTLDPSRTPRKRKTDAAE